MAQNELERVKADLEIIKTAVGMERKHTRKEVQLNIAGGVIGLLLSAMDVFILNVTNKFLSLFIIIVIAFGLYFAANTGKQEETSSQRYPKSYQWVMFIVFTLFFAGYGMWEDTFGLPHDLWLGVWFMFIGALMAMEAYWRTRKWYETIPLVSLIIFGTFVPLYPSHILAVYGFAFALGSFAYAGVIAFVICRQKVVNDTD